jgi:hypothetical protein
MFGKKLMLSWHNVSITAHPPKGCCGRPGKGAEKVILNDISGSVLPG